MPIGKGKRYRRKLRRYMDPFYNKQFFLVQSPYLHYSKSKNREFASVISTSTTSNNDNLVIPNFPPLFTCATESTGTITTFHKILNRSLEVYAPDIIPSLKEETHHHSMINLFIHNIQMKQHAETEFSGFRLSKEKISSFPQKLHSLITMNNVYKTLDGYQVRIFMMATTRMRDLQIHKKCHASNVHIKKIRTVMHRIIQKHISQMPILEFVERMAIKCEMSREIRQQCENIYPIGEDILISKIKVLEKPPRENDELQFAVPNSNQKNKKEKK